MTFIGTVHEIPMFTGG